MAQTKLVRMTADIYPWGCKGDVVSLTKDDLDQLDKVAEARGLERAYDTNIEATSEDKAPEDLKARASQLGVNPAGAEAEVQARVDDAEHLAAEQKANAVATAQNYPANTATEEAGEASQQELRARAKELGLPANGSKEDLKARIAEVEANTATDKAKDGPSNE